MEVQQEIHLKKIRSSLNKINFELEKKDNKKKEKILFNIKGIKMKIKKKHLIIN